MVILPLFSQFKWYRRLCGGKWTQWDTFLPMAPIWFREGIKPGCYCWEIKTENYFS